MSARRTSTRSSGLLPRSAVPLPLASTDAALQSNSASASFASSAERFLFVLGSRERGKAKDSDQSRDTKKGLPSAPPSSGAETGSFSIAT
eukprot:scaffold1090_cov265-Pinguiococcus_pyrenoidosus.AAC.12